ncbi:resuscitation-promoting factor [Intrasporangium calvum]|uniref:resuscitation-promoting factor n=1 Tax=Intrasporangium calvum TaxID=53358 RepID=UPI002341D197|nr:resuscitation-promoting factor [Intrasporangium calvum]
MISRNLKVIAGAGAALLLTAGGVGAAQLDKAVNLSVDGTSTATRVFGSTVGDLLESEGISVKDGDVVYPAVDAPLSDGDTVTVRYARMLNLTVDGETKQIRTTETTVDAALLALGLRTDGARISVSRSQSIGREGLDLTVITPKAVTIVADGKTTKKTVAAATVEEALTQLGVDFDSDDKVSPARATALEAGMKVVVKDVRSKKSTRTETVAHKTVRKESADLYEGTTKVATEGVDGLRRVTLRTTIVDGKVTKTERVSSMVTKAPIAEVVLVGTKSRPTTSTGTSSGSTSGTGINLARADMWDRVAECESGGNWSINTGNGYYGGLQFSYTTWLAYGGDDFAQRADLASRAEQITVANRVYADNGLAQWSCKG